MARAPRRCRRPESRNDETSICVAKVCGGSTPSRGRGARGKPDIGSSLGVFEKWRERKGPHMAWQRCGHGAGSLEHLAPPAAIATGTSYPLLSKSPQDVVV